VVRFWALRVCAVVLARLASVAGRGYWPAGNGRTARVGSPPPTRMTLLGVAPRTTLVVNVAPGPSAASAAAEVTSLVVEAGVAGWSGFCDQSTRPVAGSVTTADTRGPSADADSGAARADCRPLLVGRLPVLGPGFSTGVARLTGWAATVGTLRAASRDGSIRATVMPAASVNTLIMASVTTAASRVRRAMIVVPRGVYVGTAGTMELITQTGLERTSGR